MNTFARRAATDARVLDRSCETLLGICAGLLADDVLSDVEIQYLDLWLSDNDELIYTWPGEVIYARIRDVLKDGKITEDEREYLKKTLSDLIGGTLEETGAASGLSTKLPLDDVSEITILGHSFCFTGNFIYGTRAACSKAVIERGGTHSANVTKKLDYLVIGTMTSREWVYSTHGRKIEKAILYKEDGQHLIITNEELWTQFL